jgi:hypothetical protein
MGNWGNDWVRMLVYGEPKTGKSTFLGTVPGNILWLMASGGTVSGELKSIDTPENRSRIRAENITGAESLDELMKLAGEYDAVVLDHVTGLSDILLTEVLGLEEVIVQKQWGIATQQQYGQVANLVKKALLKLFSTPAHTFVVAQQRTAEQSQNADVEDDIITASTGPDVGKSIGRYLVPSVDYIVQTFTRAKYREEKGQVVKGIQMPGTRIKEKGVEYCMRVGPHDKYLTGFRIPRGRTLPDMIVDPTFDKIQQLIKG